MPVWVWVCVGVVYGGLGGSMGMCMCMWVVWGVCECVQVSGCGRVWVWVGLDMWVGGTCMGVGIWGMWGGVYVGGYGECVCECGGGHAGRFMGDGKVWGGVCRVGVRVMGVRGGVYAGVCRCEGSWEVCRSRGAYARLSLSLTPHYKATLKILFKKQASL